MGGGGGRYVTVLTTIATLLPSSHALLCVDDYSCDMSNFLRK